MNAKSSQPRRTRPTDKRTSARLEIQALPPEWWPIPERFEIEPGFEVIRLPLGSPWTPEDIELLNKELEDSDSPLRKDFNGREESIRIQMHDGPRHRGSPRFPSLQFAKGVSSEPTRCPGILFSDYLGRENGFPVKNGVPFSDLAQRPINPLLYVVPFIGRLLLNSTQVSAEDFVAGLFIMHGQGSHHHKTGPFD